jgi:hypothetical protein
MAMGSNPLTNTIKHFIDNPGDAEAERLALEAVSQAFQGGQKLQDLMWSANETPGFDATHLKKLFSPTIVAEAYERGEWVLDIAKILARVPDLHAADLEQFVSSEALLADVQKGHHLNGVIELWEHVTGFDAEHLLKYVTPTIIRELVKAGEKLHWVTNRINRLDGMNDGRWRQLGIDGSTYELIDAETVSHDADANPEKASFRRALPNGLVEPVNHREARPRSQRYRAGHNSPVL